MNIQIEYNGKYPNLCSGKLVATIDGIRWEFPDYCLISGGHIYMDEDYEMHIQTGRWSIYEWPENFPEELKSPVLEAINETIPHGCCGGCI